MMLLVAGAFAFAGGINPKDFANEKKLAKLVEKYNLEETKDSNTVTVYKSSDTSNWIFAYRFGDEKSGQLGIHAAYYAYLDGQFQSLYVYGEYTAPKEQFKYLYAAITETSNQVSKNDFYAHSKYTWNDPQKLFRFVFKNRQTYFKTFKIVADRYELNIPQEILDKYKYFDIWYTENDEMDIAKAVKQYCKDHPEIK